MTEATNNASGPDNLRARFDEIEREIMDGKHDAESVFTQMRTAALYTAPPAAAVVRDAFMKMRNVAAGYSNCCEFDSANTRRLEREFEAADELYRSAAAPTPEPASPWISVEDRLPLTDTTGDFKSVQVQVTDGKEVGITDFSAGGMPAPWSAFDEYGDIEPSKITHWAPLLSAPEQPAKEQEHE